MKPDIKDYLHLYLPVHVQRATGFSVTIVGIAQNNEKAATFFTKRGHFVELYEEVKPILRPLSDLTEEEKNECARVIEPFDEEIVGETLRLMAATTSYLMLNSEQKAADEAEDNPTQDEHERNVIALQRVQLLIDEVYPVA